MHTNTDFIDRGFKPSLSICNSYEFLRYQESWRMPKVATPAPTQIIDHKAAVWVGGKPSKHNEVPVLAISLPKAQKVEKISVVWYAGILPLREYNLTEDDLSILENMAKIAICLAEHGPDNFEGATSTLQQFLPLET